MGTRCSLIKLLKSNNDYRKIYFLKKNIELGLAKVSMIKFYFPEIPMVSNGNLILG